MSQQASPVWHEVLSRLKSQISPDNFNLWFASLRATAVDEDQKVLTVGVPNAFMKDWIANYYLDVLVRELSRVKEPGWRVSLSVQPAEASLPAMNATVAVPATDGALKPRSTRSPTPSPISVTEPSGSQSFNPRFCFDRFIVGHCNAVAHAASLQVSANPGKSYNPLFIHASTGLGKTHLLQATGQEIKRLFPRYRVMYVSAESFMNQLIASIRNGEMEAFNRRFRDDLDVLIIDDIQFIAGKSSTQEAFFHTFNHLHDSGRQIVISADAYPMEIKDLNERLKSRFQSGLVVDIKPPSFETRMAILTGKAQAENIPLPEDVATFIAKNVARNVRELEGGLLRMEAVSTITGRPLTVALAREVLRHLFKPNSHKMDEEGIIQTVCTYYRIKPQAIRGKGRAQNLVFPRQVAMYLLKKHTSLSLKDIGVAFGGRDHSTVLHGIAKIENLLDSDVQVQHELEALHRRLERGDEQDN